jgi:hypothetical protein
MRLRTDPSCLFPLFAVAVAVALVAPAAGRGEATPSTPAVAHALPPYQSSVAGEVEVFLRELYRSFEREDFAPFAAALGEEFTAIFYIPARGPDALHFDRQGLVEGLGKARELYAGRAPKMELENVVVLARSETEAVASFTMQFSLAGEWRGDALAIADLRREAGSWRLIRLYETKRR